MKKTLIAVMGALPIACSGTAYGVDWNNWALGGTDYYSGSPGAVCYNDTSEYVVYSCECDWDVHASFTYACPGSDDCGTRCDMDGNCETVCDVRECKLEGAVGGGYARFCQLEGALDTCMLCGCAGGAGSWTVYSSANYTVKRTVNNVSSSGYTCTGSSTTEYGCMAGYYTKSGSGSSMVCAPCPNAGTSATGNTAITGCYIANGTVFSDSTGSGTYTTNCYYSN